MKRCIKIYPYFRNTFSFLSIFLILFVIHKNLQQALDEQ